MLTEVTKKLFTVDEYYRMAETGILGPEERVELIDGEIIEMSPIGNRHAACVDRANRFFIEAFGRKAIVSSQMSLRLNKYTVPQPDLVILKAVPDFYASRPRVAEDVLFLVEVSDTTLRIDRNIKLPRYAAAGVREVWIEDLNSEVLLIHRNPAEKVFGTSLKLNRGESISPLAFPDVTFKVADLLG
jgi:Uma2 family endonuclease